MIIILSSRNTISLFHHSSSDTKCKSVPQFNFDEGYKTFEANFMVIFYHFNKKFYLRADNILEVMIFRTYIDSLPNDNPKAPLQNYILRSVGFDRFFIILSNDISGTDPWFLVS